MTIEITDYDVADHLTSPERIAAYLELAFDDGDPGRVAAALGAVRGQRA